MQQKTNLDTLRDALRNLPPGSIDSINVGEIERLLATAWDELEGSSVEGTAGYKLVGRTEHLLWNPPVLSFRIERHGAHALGSSRAEFHEWSIDIEQGKASCAPGGYRQLMAPQPRVDIAPIVRELVHHVEERNEHPALTWKSSGRVVVTLSKALPPSNNKQTHARRSRRLGESLSAALQGKGWNRVPGSARYEFEVESTE